MADNAVVDYCAEVKAKRGVSAYTLHGKLHPKQFRKGFVEGCAWAIVEKLLKLSDEAEQVKPQAASDRALMVTNAIQVYKDQKWPSIKTVKDSTIERANASNFGSGVGASAGYAAGKNFELQRGVRGGEGRAVKALKGGG